MTQKLSDVTVHHYIKIAAPVVILSATLAYVLHGDFGFPPVFIFCSSLISTNPDNRTQTKVFHGTAGEAAQRQTERPRKHRHKPTHPARPVGTSGPIRGQRSPMEP